MIRVTLDTNALRDIGWLRGVSQGERYQGDPTKQAETRAAFSRILAMRDAGRVELGVTTQLYSDFRDTLSELPQDIDALIGIYVDIATPSVFGFPLAFPAAFPDLEVYEQLFSDIFPHSQPDHQKYHSNRLDAWQLYGHRVAQRDVFITTDKGILDKRSVLRVEWLIEVQSPAGFVEAYDQ